MNTVYIIVYIEPNMSHPLHAQNQFVVLTGQTDE